MPHMDIFSILYLSLLSPVADGDISVELCRQMLLSLLFTDLAGE